MYQTGPLILIKPCGVRGQPFKTMATKSRKAAKRGNIYETVSNNIQKITRPSGTVSYRVRVTEDGVMYSPVSYTHRRCRRLVECRSRWSPYH